MGIQSKINEESMAALKSRNITRRSILAFLSSELKNLSIKKKGEQLQDSDVLKNLESQLKRVNETLEAAVQGGRSELIKYSTEELSIIKEFINLIPKAEYATELEIKNSVLELVDKLKLTSMKDMKIIMEEIPKTLSVDKSVLSKIAKEVLGV